MKQLFVFDLDGTLAPSKSTVDQEMSTLLGNLLTKARVAIISGGAWTQFEKQVLSQLPATAIRSRPTLHSVLANSPATKIKIVAIQISAEIKALANSLPNIQLIEKPYSASDLNDIDIVIAAINDPIVSKLVVQD